MRLVVKLNAARAPFALLALGCAKSPPDSADTPPDTEAPAADADGSVPLSDANNFAYEGVLDAPSLPLAELTDVALDWSGLTTDLRCNALDPVADIDNTALLVFPYLTEEEVEAGLSDDSLDQADLVLPGRHDKLSTFSMVNLVARQIGIQCAASLDAEPGLQRSGRIVEPAMDDLAVSRRYALPDVALLLEYQHSQPPQSNPAQSAF